MTTAISWVFEKYRSLYPVKFIHLFIFIAIIQFVISCEDKYIQDKKTFLVNVSNKDWLVDTAMFRELHVADSLGNTESYLFDEQWKGFIRAKNYGRNGIDYTEYETIDQEFKNSKNEIFHVLLTANEPAIGDNLTVSFKDSNYEFDLKTRRLTAIRNNEGHRPDKEYINDHIVDLPFKSKTIEHDTININGITYRNALEFILDDFEDQWKSTTTISVIIAKEIGLIQYRLNNGNVYNRVNR